MNGDLRKVDSYKTTRRVHDLSWWNLANEITADFDERALRTSKVGSMRENHT